jgi:hypothetical protein
LFNGQTQQLPFGNISKEAAGDAVAAATTTFVPDSLIADLAIRKESSYFQQFHHAGYEAYSSSRSVLITAGGIQTDHAYQAGPFPTNILINGVRDIWGLETQDRGAALPTTVMFTGAPIDDNNQGQASQIALDHFISFRGTRQDQDGDEGFNDNLCVWQNFACGTHFIFPRNSCRASFSRIMDSRTGISLLRILSPAVCKRSNEVLFCAIRNLPKRQVQRLIPLARRLRRIPRSRR